LKEFYCVDEDRINLERVEKLHEVYENIEQFLHDHATEFQQYCKHSAEAIIDCSTSRVKIDHILELAERIAPAVFAPAGWKEGLPLINAFPPTPQAEEMRLGKLAAYNASKSNIQPFTADKGTVKEIIHSHTLQISRFKSLLKQRSTPGDVIESKEMDIEEDGSEDEQDDEMKGEETNEEEKYVDQTIDEVPVTATNRAVTISFNDFDDSDEDD
jgi:hypothetical protein